ncbi:hypothetical protein MNBD_GAMMA07-39 [hydrothermal vent metagenome]|uniref:Uncharacterized protein n=1 Tax=hydrothermal vent metagenome TaxID=652676 RepID=A0A3B0WMD7_9ZZZZ
MKFSQLKIGEHFIWNEEPYIKATPLVAHHSETGASKIVPKYVNIELAETRSKNEKGLSKPDDMLEYLVSELSDAIQISTLSDAAKTFVLSEIENVKIKAVKKIKLKESKYKGSKIKGAKPLM